MLKLNQELRDMTAAGFHNDSAFQQACHRGLSQSLNMECAKLLAHFCDAQMKNVSHDDDRMLTLFDSVAQLLKHMSDKDVFLETYRHSLARRLLNKAPTSNSNELDESFIATLTLECGEYATRNLTSMLTDMALSIQLQDEYSKLPREDAAGGVKHEVRVLRSNAWPSKLSTGHAVPCADLLACVRAFGGFYCSKFSGRRLTWAYGTGSV